MRDSIKLLAEIYPKENNMSKCLNPTYHNDELKPPFPCGKCLSCVAENKNQKVSKMILEADHGNRGTAEFHQHGYHSEGAFVTLTYSPENLPDKNKYPNGNICPEDMDKFLKRFRKNYQAQYGEKEIKYSNCAEYGSKGQRAHFHINFFNLPKDQVELIVQKSWTLGHSLTKYYTTANAKYVAGYTEKKLNKAAITDGRNPEFQRSSRGLGDKMLPLMSKTLQKYKLVPARALSMLDKYIILEEHSESFPEFQKGFDLDNIDSDAFSGSFIREEQGYKTPRYYPILPNTSEHTIERMLNGHKQSFVDKRLQELNVASHSRYDKNNKIQRSIITLSANQQQKLSRMAHVNFHARLEDCKNNMLEEVTPRDIDKIAQEWEHSHNDKDLLPGQKGYKTFPRITRIMEEFRKVYPDFETEVYDHMQGLAQDTMDFGFSEDRVQLQKVLEKNARRMAAHEHQT